MCDVISISNLCVDLPEEVVLSDTLGAVVAHDQFYLGELGERLSRVGETRHEPAMTTPHHITPHLFNALTLILLTFK